MACLWPCRVALPVPAITYTCGLTVCGEHQSLHSATTFFTPLLRCRFVQEADPAIMAQFEAEAHPCVLVGAWPDAPGVLRRCAAEARSRRL